jgi:hypothetical protein
MEIFTIKYVTRAQHEGGNRTKARWPIQEILAKPEAR